MAQMQLRRPVSNNVNQDKAFKMAWATAYPQYDDKGSNASKDLSVFFAPITTPVVDGVKLSQRLGQRPVAGYPSTASVLAIRFTSESDTVAIGGGHEWWERVWCDVGSGRPDDYTVWRVKEERLPNGYVCVSPCFFRKVVQGRGQHVDDPPTDGDVTGMVAVKECYVTYVSGNNLNYVWDDRGTHADQDVAIYTGPDNIGCFAFKNYDRPAGSFPVLNQSAGVS